MLAYGQHNLANQTNKQTHTQTNKHIDISHTEMVEISMNDICIITKTIYHYFYYIKHKFQTSSTLGQLQTSRLVLIQNSFIRTLPKYISGKSLIERHNLIEELVIDNISGPGRIVRKEDFQSFLVSGSAYTQVEQFMGEDRQVY